MIDPDPNCPDCKGSGGVPPEGYEGTFTLSSMPCRCRFEPNNCDRCATLYCGEKRAPANRWEPTPSNPSGGGTLCVPCRNILFVPRFGFVKSTYLGDAAILHGNREGLRRLAEALTLAVYRGQADVEMVDERGDKYTLTLALDEAMGNKERQEAHSTGADAFTLVRNAIRS